ncbi:hypothetical protein [Aureibaculum marinum]|nr:hypothetical protein [Aureibaculum marinum]
MKKITNSLKFGALIFGISLLLWNCQKEELIEQPNLSNDISIESVKKIFNTKFKNENFSFLKKEPIWANAQSFVNNSKHYIEIPFKKITDYNLDKSSTLSVDRLLAFIDSNGKLNLKVVHYFATNNKKYPFDFYNTSYFNLKKFNGLVSIYDLENNAEKTSKVIQGKTSKQQFNVKEIDGANKKLAQKSSNCVTYYEQVVYLVT